MSQKLLSMSQKRSPWASEVRWLITCSQVITEERVSSLKEQFVHSYSFLEYHFTIDIYYKTNKLTRIGHHCRRRSRPPPAWRCSCTGRVPPCPRSNSSRSVRSCHSDSVPPHPLSQNTGGPGSQSIQSPVLEIFLIWAQIDQMLFLKRNVTLF